jgi:putative DNA primase/helicase
MARYFKDEILFDVDEHQWYTWTDNYWKPDKAGEVYRLASIGIANIYRQEANNQKGFGHNGKSDTLNKRAKSLLNKSRSTNIVHFAEKQPELFLLNAQWDADPWSLACKNGVVSLKTGELRPAKQQDYIRTVIPTDYTDIQESCPAFDKFLKDIFDEDNRLLANQTIRFMQRLLGYGITGLSVEHVLPILYGRKGRNGKDTLLKVLEHVLGEDISGPVGQEVLLSGTKSPNAATPYIYQLRFKRLAFVSETNENARMDAGQVKLLTGGGTLTGRLLNQNPITFTPQHLLCLITNFKPRAPIHDYALWNRLLLINFGISFVPNPAQPWEKKRDKQLYYKLIEEKSGILSWLIRGATDWDRHGLDMPNHIEATTNMYQQEEDDFSGFTNMFETSNSVEGMKLKDVYLEYCNWSGGQGIRRPLGKTTFARRFSEYFHRERLSQGWFYKNLKLREPEPVESISQLIGI